MDEPIVVMGICGSYNLDSANGRMLELILESVATSVQKQWSGTMGRALASSWSRRFVG